MVNIPLFTGFYIYIPGGWPWDFLNHQLIYEWMAGFQAFRLVSFSTPMGFLLFATRPRPRTNFTSLPWIRRSPSRPLSWRVSRVPLDLHRTRPRDERDFFFVLKDGNGEIFDELFDRYIGWWKLMVKRPAKTKTHRFVSRMLEYELDGTWHLGSLKKKTPIWKPISRENLEFLGFSSLVWNPPGGEQNQPVE